MLFLLMKRLILEYEMLELWDLFKLFQLISYYYYSSFIIEIQH